MEDNAFKRCNHCGELFFAEDITKEGVCKLCRDGHSVHLRYYAPIHSDD